MVQRKAIVFAREHQDKQQQSEPGNYVSVELVKRFFQEMTECDEDQDGAQRDERLARSQANNNQRPRYTFDNLDSEADYPERPPR